MNDFQKKWNRMNTLERVLTAITMGCSVAVVVLGVLYLLDLAVFGITAAMPLMGIAAIAQGGLFWKKDRPMAVMLALVGIFVIGVSVYITVA